MLKRGMFQLRVERRNDKKRGIAYPHTYALIRRGEPAVVPPAPPTVRCEICRIKSYQLWEK